MGEFVQVEHVRPSSTGVGDDPARPAADERAQHRRCRRNCARPRRKLAARSDVRAVVLYGGEKVFAAGADVKEFAGQDHAYMLRDAGRLHLRRWTRSPGCPKPVIAAVTGYALGGGCELALTADFRVSARQRQAGASRRSCSASSRARAAPSGCRGWSARPRPRTSSTPAGSSTRRRRSRSGWSTRSCLRPRSTRPRSRWRRKFAKGPALALAAAKAAIDGGLDGDLANGLRLESHLFASLFATEDRSDRHGVVHRERAGQGRRSSGADVTVPTRAEPHAPRRRSRRPGTTRSWPTSSTTTGRPAPTTRSGRSPSTSAASTTPATGSRTSPARAAGRTARRSSSAAAPASSR